MVNLGLYNALEASYESFMATLHLGWHITVLSHFLCNRCKGDPVLDACKDPIAQVALQTTSTVGRGFVPPQEGGRGDC